MKNTDILAAEVSSSSVLQNERISECIQLEHDECDDVYSLRMDVSHPHLNLSYYLLYVPPRKAEGGD